MSQNLTDIAIGLADNLHKMRDLLPGVADDKLIFIAEAVNDTGGIRKEAPTEAPPTLAAALTRILKASGQASRGELSRAIERDGLSYLAQGKDLYGTIGRVLTQGNQFEPIHRGLWTLRTTRPLKVTLPSNMSEKAKTTLHSAARLTQPFLARDVVSNSQLKMPWVIVGLKELHKTGKVKVVEKLTNGMARWAIVPD